MSVVMVHEKLIGALAQSATVTGNPCFYYMAGTWIEPVREHVANVLQTANEDAIAYRYSEPVEDRLPPFEDYAGPWRTLTGLPLLGCVECLEYQLEDMPGYESSEACAILKAIKYKALEDLGPRWPKNWGEDL